MLGAEREKKKEEKEKEGECSKGGGEEEVNKT